MAPKNKIPGSGISKALYKKIDEMPLDIRSYPQNLPNEVHQVDLKIIHGIFFFEETIFYPSSKIDKQVDKLFSALYTLLRDVEKSFH